ncbi:MAG: MFS transporter [Inquilinus limosus]|uniref:MFS transporter n=1 Tax=Inquilinus limosus TaxID=171674 RepID=A0A952KDX2_9PROT|nr:MFS transporter [Inquilinus limosus]
MSAHSPAVAAPAPLDHATVRSIIIGIMLAMLLAALDQTIVATALPTIGQELGDVEHLSWVVSAYLLASTAVTPLYGKFSDIHGRRVTLLVSITVFIVGSVACALAPTMLALILARALQGLGGGGLISLAQTIIADVVSPKERGRYQGYIASVFVTSSVVGPVLGGLIADHLHWSVILWINLPLGLGAFWMVWGALRRLPRHERRHRLDVLGAVLMVGATVAAMLALTWGGSRYAWDSAEILGLFGASLVFWVLFALRLLKADEPLIPLAVMSNPVVGTGTAAAFCVMGTFIGLSIYVPVYLEGILGLSASNAGLALMPLMAGTVTGANIAGRFMARMTHYKRTPLVGLVIAAVALVLLAADPAGWPMWVVEVLLAAIGLGLGTVLPVTTISIQNAVAMHQLGTATGCMNFFRSLGSAIVVAGFGAIVLGAIGGGPGQSAENLGDLTPAMRDGLVGAFHWLFLAAAVGLALGFVWLLLMEERPLRSGAAAHAKEALVE